MATTINPLESQSLRKLPSQILVNLRENANTIVIKNGKEVEILVKAAPSSSEQGKDKDVTSNKGASDNDDAPKQSKKDEQNKELYKTLRKCEVNIPLLDAIKQVPRYAKFLKELRKQKLKGDTEFEKAMLGLRAFINVMPYFIYTSLKLGPLIKIGVIIQLANRSNAYPKGMIEDVLVQVNELFRMKSLYLLFCRPPTLDLKHLPNHLIYVFLGDGRTLPVVISNELSTSQEEKLVQVLKEHRIAIGWTIANIKEISPSTCMHRILLEERARSSHQCQRRLNPPMIDVVKKEILKLLEVGVIYPISDSNWVNPVQVVPKKTRITVVKNQNNELVTTLLKLGGGYPSYFQIAIALEDQEKTIIEIFMDDFTVYGDSFDNSFYNFVLVLKRCMETNLELNSERKSLYGFYYGFIKDFFKIALSLCQLLQMDMALEFDETCKKVFDKLKEILTSAPIIQPHDWNFPFEIMCDARNFTMVAVLGQRIGNSLHGFQDSK
ncbi:uncharacterized protein LOC111383181 [Olea europaea var. sylvestris]|uniref:uncharacterized protein LOC111383181 n=1 Tax=Olea europaea var. sylvestris TaxID=158386 RepID=UPI000C1D53E7|nr:uncharacterized protein LOC111383181 [Olea europaea var. sylvestris]